jgi:hypothetical protein
MQVFTIVIIHVLLQQRGLTTPNSHNTVSPPLNKIPILDPNPLNDSGGSTLLIFLYTRPTIPMSPIGFIVDLSHRLARSRDDPSSIEHHAGDWVIVGKSVVNGTGAEIPYLELTLVGKFGDRNWRNLREYFCLNCQ